MSEEGMGNTVILFTKLYPLGVFELILEKGTSDEYTKS